MEENFDYIICPPLPCLYLYQKILSFNKFSPSTIYFSSNYTNSRTPRDRSNLSNGLKLDIFIRDLTN